MTVTVTTTVAVSYLEWQRTRNSWLPPEATASALVLRRLLALDLGRQGSVMAVLHDRNQWSGDLRGRAVISPTGHQVRWFWANVCLLLVICILQIVWYRS